jgi:hypothetical protein
LCERSRPDDEDEQNNGKTAQKTGPVHLTPY